MRAMSEADVKLRRKEEIKGNSPPEVFEKTKLSDDAENLLKTVQTKMGNMNYALKSQKKNTKKFGNLDFKYTGLELINSRYEILMSKITGIPVDEKKDKENLTTLQQIDKILEKRSQEPDAGHREPNEEELKFFQEVDNEMKKQNVGLQHIATNLKEIKAISSAINKDIDEMGKSIKKTSEAAKKTEKKLETTNAKLKDLLAKIRSGDRICIDIILILICLGLIAVLYNTIKSRIGSSSSTTTTKTFLYI
jgi:hypothetical protein